MSLFLWNYLTVAFAMPTLGGLVRKFLGSKGTLPSWSLCITLGFTPSVSWRYDELPTLKCPLGMKFFSWVTACSLGLNSRSLNLQQSWNASPTLMYPGLLSSTESMVPFLTLVVRKFLGPMTTFLSSPLRHLVGVKQVSSPCAIDGGIEKKPYRCLVISGTWQLRQRDRFCTFLVWC